MRKPILVLALVSALANQAHSFDLKDSIYEEAGLRYNIDPTWRKGSRGSPSLRPACGSISASGCLSG